MSNAHPVPPPLPKAQVTQLAKQAEPRSVQYEILRRSDGMMALSITRGLMGFSPAGMRLIGSDSLEILSAGRDESVQIRKIPGDLLAWIDKLAHIRLYEFSPSASALGHDVHLVS